MNVVIRDEEPHDIPDVRNVNVEAFGQCQEARLVDLLRVGNEVMLSLVAEVDGRLVGHILFSPVRLPAADHEPPGAGLGPMAVLPGFQSAGIGSKLVREGIQRLRTLGCPFVVVLGHQWYYPRFGFAPASRFHVRCEWEVPDDAFMLLPLDETALAGASGIVRYREEFSSVT